MAVMSYVKTGLILEIRNRICCNRKGNCWDYLFENIKKYILKKINRVHKFIDL